MPVNIKLRADVQSDDAQTTDDFRVIGNLLRTQHNAAGKVIHIVVNLAQESAEIVRLEALAPLILPVSSKCTTDSCSTSEYIINGGISGFSPDAPLPHY